MASTSHSPALAQGRSVLAQYKLPLSGKLFSSNNGLKIFAALLCLAYGVVPIYLYFFRDGGPESLTLAAITVVGVTALYAGSQMRLLDSRFASGSTRLYLSTASFTVLTWCLFLAFLAVTFLTAPTIPILSAFTGASADDLSQERGEFLKGRDGIGLALLYISTFLTNTIVPYSIVVLYIVRSKMRHVLALVFFLFCVSFLQKALFLNLILPLAAYFATSPRYRGQVFIALIGGSILLLFGATFLSVGGDLGVASLASGDYFSSRYVATGSIDYLVWRAFAVPVFTAIDTLVVHQEWLKAQPLLGATSNLLATLSGMERINLERLVFEYQFGSWNEIANANTVFLVDAFVNFSWIGVVVFGFFVGMVFRWFRISRDLAFKSLWPLFAFILFSAPLIGMLFSNGFLYMLFHALFIRVGHHDREAR